MYTLFKEKPKREIHVELEISKSITKKKKSRKAAETSPGKWNLQPQTSLFIFLRHLVEFKEKNFKKMHHFMWNGCGRCMRKLNAGPGHNGYFIFHVFNYIMCVFQHFNALSHFVLFLSIYVLFMFHIHNNNVYGTVYNGNNNLKKMPEPQ